MQPTPSAELGASLIGREHQLKLVEACLHAGKNVLLEGAVGTGKTTLAVAAAKNLSRPIFRLDGDGRYSEQKLTGWFDPPAAIRVGYGAEAFIAGPLVQAMRAGGILLINELNRLPEGVQNVLLPAMDEGLVTVPQLGVVRAEPGFRIIATQNPKEFVATSHLSEAILDRFELVTLDYQTEREETDIVLSHLQSGSLSNSERQRLASMAVRVARATRNDPRIRRGASVRAAISIAEIAACLLGKDVDLQRAILEASKVALPTRIEMQREIDESTEAQGLADGWLSDLIQLATTEHQKKNSEANPQSPARRLSRDPTPWM